MPTFALLLTLLGTLQDDLDKRISALIADLRSEDIATREKANKDLMGLGVDALPRLEKIQATAEGEVRTRLGTAIDHLRREVKLLIKAPPVRLVTVSARDRPLKEFLDDIGRQAGVTCEADPAVANLTVSIESKGDPLLKVLDRACHTRADVTFEIAKGKLRMIPGDHPKVPTAYSGPFRARLMKVAAPKANDSVLHCQFDAQPDQDYISVTGSGASPSAGFTIRPASQIPMTTWLWTSTTGMTVQLDGVQVQAENWKDIGGAFVVNRDEGAAPTLETLRIRARFHFPLDSSPVESAMTEHPRRLSVGSYEFIFRGPKMFVQRPDPLPKLPRLSLEELADLDSFWAVDADGKKEHLVMFGTRNPFPGDYIYQFKANKDLLGRTVKLQYSVYNLADREVEFELKDVKLRD